MIEKESPLQNRSVLIVESEIYAQLLIGECMVNRHMRRAKFLDDLPIEQDLLKYMDDEHLDAAILHATIPDDEESIVEAHDAGKKIVILKRDPPSNNEQQSFYKRLEQRGISTITKDIENRIEDYVNILEKLFE